jgi:CHASE3 domain sensor protein
MKTNFLKKIRDGIFMFFGGIPVILFGLVVLSLYRLSRAIQKSKQTASEKRSYSHYRTV